MDSHQQMLKQQHELRIQKKAVNAEKKRDEESAIKEWTNTVSLDSILLSHDSGSIVSIASKPVHVVTANSIRALCIKLKISGYKNKRKDEMVLLLLERKKNEFIEKSHYAASRVYADGSKNQEDSDSEQDSWDSTPDKPGATRTIVADSSSDDGNCEDENEDGGDSKMPAVVSSPVTRSAAAKAAAAAVKTPKKRVGKKLLMESSALKKSKICKSTVPSVVTRDGTYYRAINVWFDDRSRIDIVNMGASPSIRELDSRKKFSKKSTYDKLLATYLDDSAENSGLNFIGFSDEYLNDCGIADEYAAEFDILTSEELCNVLDYIVHWYNVSYRNNKTSGMCLSCYNGSKNKCCDITNILVHSCSTTGNHADFHQFVGSRPYVYYYHLWLVEIPHLSFLAVPQLSTTVFRMTMMMDDKATPGAQDLDTSSTTSSLQTWSAAGNDAVLALPTVKARGRRSKHHAPPAGEGLGAAGDDTRKWNALELHLKKIETIQSENAILKQEKEERARRLALTVELKTVEEMLVMKKLELKEFNDDEDSESEKDFVSSQIKKLRKKQRSLVALIYTSDDEEEDQRGSQGPPPQNNSTD
jgi:hypothetical protein